ncbi:MAG: diguanylate cyclase/phosphodiesterase (GGDEF & EAL domains) with PAS/PAC sensor(s) [uncultured Nocardioidaceae bacterium]|uniref:Diguanylate cyclase/phosphodiesterase (GGDEF & EAL domains) with PAS/PAC sensor(S) n=1 Tax=uncultured Nocardioidaceae bacterium TaxID=253824 RepID=A0A6J4MAP3_9ACTN|nr:MAG: diguanylate cyclase/phosphodiesterase (GGDEF & EAL domains) with PAS/PAC sensor(s) [uncultured Nocardioidaceae bacterium]
MVSRTPTGHEAVTAAHRAHPETSDQRVFWSLLDQVPGILYVAEVGFEGRWLYVSPQVEDLLGWTAQEWTADPTLFARALHPDDYGVEARAASASQTLPGGRDVSEYRLTTRDGRLRWFRDDARLLADELGRPALWSGVLTDVTEQRRAALRLSRSDQRARAIIDTAMDAYVAIDAQGAIIDWNRAAETVFGWTRRDILGRRLVDTIVPAWFASAHLAGPEEGALEEALGAGRVLQVSATRRDGTELPVELTLWRTDDEQGGACFSLFLRDITERERLQARLTAHAYRDPLTGFANRALFQQRLGDHLGTRAAQAELRSATGFAVLVVGLDDFRPVSVSLGPEAADELLMTVAERLTAHTPDESLLARLSDDEFAVLVPEVPGRADAQQITDELARELRSSSGSGERELTVRASIGVRHCPAGCDASVEELMSDAAAAMVAATRSGRTVAFFEDSLRAANLRRLRLMEALEHAVERDEIYVAYQPYFSFHDGRARGVEALARWRHPAYGEVSPAEFIVLAESTGQIQSVGLFVLARACRDIARLRREMPRHADLALSINVSARQLVDGRLQQQLSTVLEETGLPGDALTLELTETALVEDELDVAERLTEIRAMGVHLAVDDFGTRFASLAYLQRFPVDTLKVDRSFVALLHESAQEQRLTGAIITLAKTLGLRTIAEGIEEDEAARWLSGLGCDAGQGFLFARPIALERLAPVLRAGERRVHEGLVASGQTTGGTGDGELWAR